MAAKKKSTKSVGTRVRRTAPRSATTQASPAHTPATPAPAARADQTQSPVVSLGWLGVGILVLGILVFWIWKRGPEATVPAATPPVAVASPQSEITPSVQAIPEKASTKPTREPQEVRSHNKESQDSGLAFSLGSGKPLDLRCWRSKDAAASLSIFGRHNHRVRSLHSATGPEGWVTLSWNGTDEQGHKVTPGRYFALPSQEGDQAVVELKVRN